MSKKLLIVALIMMASTAAFASDAFTALDVDKSGTISSEEAGALPSLADQLTALDIDKNGELSAEEFANYEASQAK